MALDMSQVVGMVATLYGVAGALSVLLQARQMHARGSSSDVSARFLTTYVGGYAIWLLYGFSIGDLPIILVHAVGLLCGTVTLAVALKLRGPLSQPATARRAPKPGECHRPHRFRANRNRVSGVHAGRDPRGRPESVSRLRNLSRRIEHLGVPVNLLYELFRAKSTKVDGQSTLDDQEIAEFSPQLGGDRGRPTDPAYDEVRAI